MAKAQAFTTKNKGAGPDYERLVRFLLEPLLDTPDSLVVDCEHFNNQPKVWLRLAFEQADKGRVFGRGGRNLQAIKHILETTAITGGKSLYLDVYGGSSHGGSASSSGEKHPENREEGKNRSSNRPSRPVKGR